VTRSQQLSGWPTPAVSLVSEVSDFPFKPNPIHKDHSLNLLQNTREEKAGGLKCQITDFTDHADQTAGAGGMRKHGAGLRHTGRDFSGDIEGAIR
jgi:hypothetical protein